MRLILLVLSMALVDSARAGTPSNDSPEGLVVHGRTTQEFRQLVDSMAVSRSGRQIARWDDRVCTRIYGLEPQHATYVKTRIDEVAAMLKVSTAKSQKCRPNVTVVFALNADELAEQIVSTHPNLVGEVARGAVNKRSKAAYLKPRAVRWFGQDTVKREELPIATRLKTGSRQTISSVLLLVDFTKLQGISWGQLADYLSLVAMSRPKLDHRYDDPATILSLFVARDSGKPLPSGLTALDKSFLVNLYSTQTEQTAQRQQQDIRRHVRADLAKASGQTSEASLDDQSDR